MTVIKLSDEERRAEALLESAEAHYAEVLEQLDTVKMYLKDRTDLSEAEIRRVFGEYRRATQTLFDEKKRLEDLRKKELGIVHEYALDFDDVRREIGGKLDRLRRAQGSDGVS